MSAWHTWMWRLRASPTATRWCCSTATTSPVSTSELSLTLCARKASASSCPTRSAMGAPPSPSFLTTSRTWHATRAILRSLNLDKAMIVGHSMGGMLAARFATQYPDVTERLVLFNPIGLTDTRFNNPVGDPEAAYKRTLTSTYQTIRASLMRYVAHKPSAWNSEFESYVRIRYAWTLSADWPRLARVQTLISNLIYLDPVVDDWAHIQAPTFVFGGAEDMLAGTPAAFQEGMKHIAATIPNAKARLQLLPGLGHVPFMEDPARSLPPLVAFLKEGL